MVVWGFVWGDATVEVRLSFEDASGRLEGVDVVMWRWLRRGVASCELAMTLRIVVPELGAFVMYHVSTHMAAVA